MQNRNVVPRARPARPHVARESTRTIEFDCSQIANVLDAVTAKPPAPDLEAEIEVVAAMAAPSGRSKDRFAHTLKRRGAELKAEGSRPMLPLAAPPITEEELDIDTSEDAEPAAVTRAMHAAAEPMIEAAPVLPVRVRPRRSWILPVSAVLFVGSAIALIAAVL
ncbi:MAG: hypothetical protein ABI175_11470 [Polyangiales bacterium]